MNTKPNEDWGRAIRLAGLRRFAVAISVLTLLGHGWLGFETSWINPLVSLLTGYVLELVLEWVDARAHSRALRFAQEGFLGVVNFLLPAHITSLAVSMLLYPNERLFPVVFATAVAMGSKHIWRCTVDGKIKHFMNPSNLGIALTLVLFPWVGIAMPYQYTENLSGAGDWVLPAIIICSGTFINFRYTKRLPLLGCWCLGFIGQGVLRTLFFDATFVSTIAPMTGMAFLLFTYYMLTDPATSPYPLKSQMAFGFAVALAYGVLTAMHIVFGFFFALVIVCALRGAWMLFRSAQETRGEALTRGAAADAQRA
ncbi:MAG: enediyne biosynthesis protein UnbU [Myxococcota bacterium]|jgi:hypothetical protein|nr:enediyne biosynthesis protein UnbU [Myxococcota bacterium]